MDFDPLPLESEIIAMRMGLSTLMNGWRTVRKRQARFQYKLALRRCEKRLIKYLNVMNKYTNSTLVFGHDSSITRADLLEYSEARKRLKEATDREERIREYIEVLDQIKFVDDLGQCKKCSALIFKEKIKELPCHKDTVCQKCYNEIMNQDGNLCGICQFPYNIGVKERDAIS